MQGCAFARLLYGAKTWYVKNTTKLAIGKYQTTINRAAGAILPVYKTTPVPVLLQESGWAPAIAWLDRIRDRLAVRIAATDSQHPLRCRWDNARFRWIRARQDVE